MSLGFAVPFGTSLSIIEYKTVQNCWGFPKKQNFSELNRHILTLLHPKFVVQAPSHSAWCVGLPKQTKLYWAKPAHFDFTSSKILLYRTPAHIDMMRGGGSQTNNTFSELSRHILTLLHPKLCCNTGHQHTRASCLPPNNQLTLIHRTSWSVCVSKA